MNTGVMSVYAMVKKTETIPLGLTAMKDVIISIIDLGEKMSDIVVKDANNLQIGIRFRENKKIINSLRYGFYFESN